jgi:hypothetical protein
MFVFLWECTTLSYITGLVIAVGRSQCNIVLICIRITSHELYQPKSGMPCWSADVVLIMQMTCEKGSTME